MTRPKARWHPALITEHAWSPASRSTPPSIIEAADKVAELVPRLFRWLADCSRSPEIALSNMRSVRSGRSRKDHSREGDPGLEKIVTTPATIRTTG